jgi:hypothetical protein
MCRPSVIVVGHFLDCFAPAPKSLMVLPPTQSDFDMHEALILGCTHPRQGHILVAKLPALSIFIVFFCYMFLVKESLFFPDFCKKNEI